MKHVIKPSALALAVSITPAAHALDLQWGEGAEAVKVGLTNEVTYGLQMRTEDPNREGTVARLPSPALAATNPNQFLYQSAMAGRVANGNDGNLNMDKTIVSNRLSLLSELSIDYQNMGAFVRGRAWYDAAYNNRSPEHWTPNSYTFNPVFLPKKDFNGSDLGSFEQETEDYMGSQAEILDANLFYNFDIAQQPASVRVGKQAINWGEGLVFGNGISSSINPVDANAGTRAGVEIKEILMPTEAVYGQFALTNNLGLQIFSQWKHRPTELFPVGTFWSDSDTLGAGSLVSLNPGGANKTQVERDARDSGQFGVAVRYTTDGGTDFGLYALNYHDKTPSVVADPAKSYYEVFYAEDISLYGASFSTEWAGANVAGEISYRPNAIAVLDPTCTASFGCNTHLPAEPVRAEYTQAQISAVKVFEPTALWENLNIAAELVSWRYGTIKNGDNGDEDSLFVTNTPDGYAFFTRVEPGYNNVIAGANITVPMTMTYGLSGTNARTNAREDVLVASIGVEARFPSDLRVSMTYTSYNGEDDDQYDKNFYSLADRDNVAIAVKYSF